MKEVYELLIANNLVAYLVVAGPLIVVISKGGFALSTARSRSRRDLIELWTCGNKEDDFWLESIVRHGFGRFLPARAIRVVLGLKFPAFKLLKMSESWAYLKYDGSVESITWKRQWRSRFGLRWSERVVVFVGYVLFAWVAIHFLNLDGSLVHYMLVAYFLLISALCLLKLIDLFGAESAIRLIRGDPE